MTKQMTPNIREIINRAIYAKERWDRDDYVGASEIAKCPLDLYYAKSEDDGFRGNGKTERGHAIEVALIRLLKKGGMDIRYHAGHVDHQKELAMEGYPVKAHPDGIVYEKRKPAAVLEVKSVGTAAFRALTAAKESWIVQARLNAYLAGVPKALIVAVDASDLENVKEWRFDAMSETEAKEYGEKAKAIFAAIELGIEPEPEPSAENCKYCHWKERCANRWIPDDEAKTKEVEAPEIADAVEAMRKAKELKDEAKALESWAKPAILEAAKSRDAGRLKAGGFVAVVTPRKGSVRLDTKRLKAEHPEIEWSEYEKRGADTVALTIKEEA